MYVRWEGPGGQTCVDELPRPEIGLEMGGCMMRLLSGCHAEMFESVGTFGAWGSLRARGFSLRRY